MSSAGAHAIACIARRDRARQLAVRPGVSPVGAGGGSTAGAHTEALQTAGAGAWQSLWCVGLMDV